MSTHLIYSFEHRAWWRPDSRGYTDDVARAGSYSLAEAAEICDGLDPRREETPVPRHVAYAIVGLERERVRRRAYDAENELRVVEVEMTARAALAKAKGEG